MSQILIVEDEERLAAFIDKGLRKHGYSTTIAGDGEQALRIAQEDSFDLMLLDLGLPVVDGWMVLKELRQQGEKRPIIVVTARKDEQEKAFAFGNGATDFVTKPFRFSDLLECIQTHLMTQCPDDCATSTD
ncbi:response regulator transcription factor [Leptothermofonsia sp. ETS-13]|uniref:response regulator transcription factor n=1 Tax=Leptothermofonsia sp. ETS-13 TaxID=3035696 RepID=UPI003BA3518F